MKRNLILSLFIALTVSSFSPATYTQAEPFRQDIKEQNKNNIYYYPDLKQTDPYSCGPVSAANGIIMLSKNGFPDLYLSDNSTLLVDELSKYVKLIKEKNKGTTTNNICRGLEKFIKDKGYKISKIEYQGLRPADIKYKTSGFPDIEKIKLEINKGNIVLLNLGIYTKNNKNYIRHYGHWVIVTPAGNNNELTIHDPYSKISGNIYIKPNKIKIGKFIHNSDDNEKTLNDNASGFYEILQKFDYFKDDEISVINGAVFLEPERTFK